MVATLVGLSVTLFFLRPKQIRLDFEEAPLTPGRSLTSEHMCQDIVQIYNNTNQGVFDFQSLEKPDSNLATFEKFAQNCILRLNEIEKRKEAGVEKPLVLPTHGPWENEEEGSHNDTDSLDGSLHSLSR